MQVPWEGMRGGGRVEEGGEEEVRLRKVGGGDWIGQINLNLCLLQEDEICLEEMFWLAK